ncbi:hypothetical protein FISHEDRAFT_56635 [Fistulina hepatica ATCC 64428]|uniref:Uncharacterized protein n=1 Tax=Fistulina hepatica ATCC 64428 TaxID=1128425 RepID=A0A0D7AIB8_9AGAR|nr:hypothetical protein FISHEDRAFT_56635 [Fistulina hepatica ATCC 64428]
MQNSHTANLSSRSPETDRRPAVGVHAAESDGRHLLFRGHYDLPLASEQAHDILIRFREVISPFPISSWIVILAQLIGCSYQAVDECIVRANDASGLRFPGGSRRLPTMTSLLTPGMTARLYRTKTQEGDDVIMYQKDGMQCAPLGNAWCFMSIENVKYKSVLF